MNLLTEGASFGQASKSSEPGSTSQNTDEEKPETNALVRVMEELREMRQVIGRVEKRIGELEAEKRNATTVLSEAKPLAVVAVGEGSAVSTQPEQTSQDRKVLDFFSTTTFNLMIDGYYGYNFNKPVGRRLEPCTAHFRI